MKLIKGSAADTVIINNFLVQMIYFDKTTLGCPFRLSCISQIINPLVFVYILL